MGFLAASQSVRDSVRGWWWRRHTLLFAIESYQSRLGLLAHFEAHV